MRRASAAPAIENHGFERESRARRCATAAAQSPAPRRDHAGVVLEGGVARAERQARPRTSGQRRRVAARGVQRPRVRVGDVDRAGVAPTRPRPRRPPPGVAVVGLEQRRSRGRRSRRRPRGAPPGHGARRTAPRAPAASPVAAASRPSVDDVLGQRQLGDHLAHARRSRPGAVAARPRHAGEAGLRRRPSRARTRPPAGRRARRPERARPVPGQLAEVEPDERLVIGRGRHAPGDLAAPPRAGDVALQLACVGDAGRTTRGPARASTICWNARNAVVVPAELQERVAEHAVPAARCTGLIAARAARDRNEAPKSWRAAARRASPIMRRASSGASGERRAPQQALGLRVERRIGGDPRLLHVGQPERRDRGGVVGRAAQPLLEGGDGAADRSRSSRRAGRRCSGIGASAAGAGLGRRHTPIPPSEEQRQRQQRRRDGPRRSVSSRSGSSVREREGAAARAAAPPDPLSAGPRPTRRAGSATYGKWARNDTRSRPPSRRACRTPGRAGRAAAPSTTRSAMSIVVVAQPPAVREARPRRRRSPEPVDSRRRARLRRSACRCSAAASRGLHAAGLVEPVDPGEEHRDQVGALDAVLARVRVGDGGDARRPR